MIEELRVMSEALALQDTWEDELTTEQRQALQQLKQDGWEVWLEVITHERPMTLVFHWGRMDDQAREDSDPVPYPGPWAEAFEQGVEQVQHRGRTPHA
ncbi:hypothetical protein K7W42_07515 [Deinococcus sp. HMF7604]|uniref:hypothetical protein n=1 Tax=Deinococcus betulae TaxID=2873312 RepID=UPI001CCDAB62|nr:hypothetical protein [Deinococcus betulae]MBZ9750708.1 hypothetical protein [Deinococcus betulae]